MVWQPKLSDRAGCQGSGRTVPANRYVPIGTILNSQEAADKLPKITNDYPFKKLDAGVVHVNVQLADDATMGLLRTDWLKEAHEAEHELEKIGLPATLWIMMAAVAVLVILVAFVPRLSISVWMWK